MRRPQTAALAPHALASCVLALVLTGCGGDAPQGQAGDPAAPARGGGDTPLIQIDGSSTVFPIIEAVAEEFQIAQQGGVRVTVGVSGTGGGFKKFCRGETAISNASRPILTEEIEACRAAGVEFIELPIAFDALTVAVNPQNDWLQSMTVEQLRTLWSPEAQGTVQRWSQVDPAWPDTEFALFGAGADSGTFDYFTEAVMGKAKSSRGDFTASEDDNVLVTGVASDPNALGFFGYAYYRENQDKLRAIPIRATAESEGVLPSLETVESGTYTPLSRPVFIYVNAKDAEQRPEVRQIVEFFLEEATPLITEVGYVPLPEQAYQMALQKFEARDTGTVFEGHSEVGVRIEELLQRDAR